MIQILQQIKCINGVAFLAKANKFPLNEEKTKHAVIYKKRQADNLKSL